MENKVQVIAKGEYSNEVHKMIKLSAQQKQDFVSQMEKYSNSFLKENFNIELKIPIEIDGRLTKTGGSFHFKVNRKDKTYESVKIKVSERFVACALKDESEGVNAILDVLNHELVHYALCELKKDFNDGSTEFEETLARLHIGSSGATRKEKRLSQRRNVWYKMQDLYYCPITKKQYVNNHTQKRQEWIGQRVGYQIVKSYF